MKQAIKRWFRLLIGGGLFLALTSGCGTLTGATLGGAAGAGIGAATHSNVGRSAAIGAGVGGTAGALYDIFGCCGHDHYRD